MFIPRLQSGGGEREHLSLIPAFRPGAFMGKTRTLILLLTICWSAGCVSVRQSTRNLNTLRDPDRLKSDVDYVYARLQKYHPRLYEYTRKDVLDYKFDSLKSSIVEPMTSNDFFFYWFKRMQTINTGLPFPNLGSNNPRTIISKEVSM